MEYVSIALMVVSMVLMVIMKGKNKGKSGNIGKRYWADTIQGMATYSTRTATMWVNRVFDSSENGCMVSAHIPYAGNVGQTWWSHSIGETNMASTGFHIPYMPAVEWDGQDALNARRNCIPNMSKGWARANPAYPCHYQGAAILVCNQIYLGLNGAQYPSYNAILTAIPGTVYELMSSAPEFNNMDYWVRWRYTNDCGQTVSIHPVAIIADILLDQKSVDDIDWVSFAQAGRKLHKEFPYMWFAMQFGETTIKSAVESVLAKARLAIKTMPDGRLGLRVIGELPDDGILGLTMIDALVELAEFSMTRSSIDNSEVINIAAGSYAAARADSAVTTVYDVYSQIVPYTEMDSFIKWMGENQQVLLGKSIYEVAQMYPGYKTEWDIAHAANKVAALSTNEWHYKTADIYAINAANIVSTGVRKKETFDLDYLNWPDDASAALQDTLSEREKPYIMASITSSMRLWDKTVGDSLRMVVQDAQSAVTIDKVFVITDMEITGFPEETISMTLKEHSKWYDVFSVPQGEVGGGDPTKPLVYPPNSSVYDEEAKIYTLSDGTRVDLAGAVTLPAGSVFNDAADMWLTPGGYRFYDDGTLLNSAGGYVVMPPRGAEPNSSPAPLVPTAPYRPIPQEIFQLPMVAHTTSPFIRGGMPVSHFCVSWATPILLSTAHYLVDSCAPDALREPDNLIAQGAKTWPFNFTLDEDVTIPDAPEGMIEELEINATMWVPEAANIEECARLLTEKTTAVGGLSGFLYDAEYDGVGYFLASPATQNNPSGSALMLRYTFREVYSTADRVHVRLRGIYLCDRRMEMRLPKGSIVTLLPDDSDALTVGSSAYPVPEGYGLMVQSIGHSTRIRSVPVRNGQELMWSRCFCAEYRAEPEHNVPPAFSVWAAREGDPAAMLSADSVVFVSSAADRINVWVNAHDFRTTHRDTKLANMSLPCAPSGLDPLMSARDTPKIKSVAAANAGARGFVSKARVFLNDTFRLEVALLSNPLHFNFSLAELGIKVVKGDKIDVEVVGRYDYYTDFPDLPSASEEITVLAPQILVM